MGYRITLFRWFGLLSFLSFLSVGWSPVGCSSPCDTLANRVCTQLQKDTKALCSIAKSECRKPGVSGRRCQALLAYWPSLGRKYVQNVRIDYNDLRADVTSMTFREGKRRLAREEQRFRKHFYALLRFSWKLPRVGKRHRRRRRRRRRGRRTRRRRTRN